LADIHGMKSCRLLLLGVACLATGFAQRVGVPTNDLEKLSVDELFTIQVTSVGRKAQQLSTAPAAVFVLTADDIRRSGATSVPEALRWVPGLSVLQQDGRSWAISARGFSRLYANKILVMIDGRSLYTPLFSGVIWDSLDLPLEDIEQIEVVRGPGAVMWGPNAVNGVINIITRHAKATKGGLVSAAAGNQMRGSATARWGAAAGDRVSYRVWGKFDHLTPAWGSPGYYAFYGSVLRGRTLDNLTSSGGRVGFRLEGQPTEKDEWSLQGDLYKIGRHDAAAIPVLGPLSEDQSGHTGYAGGYLQGRWVHTTSRDGEGVLQFSYVRQNVDYPFQGGTFTNFNLDYQRRRHVGERNELYWGVGYQTYGDDTYVRPYARFDPKQGRYHSGDVVLRDEWQIVPSRLTGSAGIRVDYNSYRQLEYQPSVRLLFTPNAAQSAWLALSRAVRAPDRLDRDLEFMYPLEALGIPLPIEVKLTGSKLMHSETERSIEAGYRLQSGQRWSVDASLFASEYGRLRASSDPLVPVWTGTTLIFTRTFVNAGAGSSHGGELWGTFQVRPGWRLLPSYSYVKEREWLPDPLIYSWDRDPSDLRHQGTLRSQHDLSRRFQLDLMARARSRDLAYGNPGALLFDARLAWRPAHSGEFSFLVSNIADRHLVETYPEAGYRSIPIRRTFVFKWTQRF
jgi:iron complex outermembrane recepter protein